MKLIKQFSNDVSVLFTSERNEAFKTYEKPKHISALMDPTTRQVISLHCGGTPCEICPFDNIHHEHTSCNQRAALILKKLTTKITKTKELHAVLH